MLPIIDERLIIDHAAEIIARMYTALKYNHEIPVYTKSYDQSRRDTYQIIMEHMPAEAISAVYKYIGKIKKSVAFRLFKPLILRALINRMPKLIAKTIWERREERKRTAKHIEQKARELLRKKGEDV